MQSISCGQAGRWCSAVITLIKFNIPWGTTCTSRNFDDYTPQIVLGLSLQACLKMQQQAAKENNEWWLELIHKWNTWTSLPCREAYSWVEITQAGEDLWQPSDLTVQQQLLEMRQAFLAHDLIRFTISSSWASSWSPRPSDEWYSGSKQPAIAHTPSAQHQQQLRSIQLSWKKNSVSLLL